MSNLFCLSLKSANKPVPLNLMAFITARLPCLVTASLVMVPLKFNSFENHDFKTQKCLSIRLVDYSLTQLCALKALEAIDRSSIAPEVFKVVTFTSFW